jgi:hypothetical protein
VGATYPTYAGFTLALVEDFPAAIDLDNDPIFTWSDGSPLDGATRFRESQISFANGMMTITSDSTCPLPAAACIPSGVSYAESAPNKATGPVAAMNIWSGELRSKYNNYRYGHYEAKYSAPTANPGHATDPANSGNFVSTMFAFRTPKWQWWNEIDVELIANGASAMGHNVIDAYGMIQYSPNFASPGSATMGLPAGFQIQQMHVYAFEWTPTSITWFVDGGMVASYAGTAADPIPTRSAKIMANLWSLGNAAAFGDPTKNVYPFSSTYDYIHFYKWNQETTYPCTPTPSCLPATDLNFSQNNPNEPNYPN